MTKSELRDKLKNNGMNADMYSLDGGLPNEAYCLNNNNGTWEVYYSERGLKTGLKSFDNESEACVHFYNLIMGETSNENWGDIMD